MDEKFVDDGLQKCPIAESDPEGCTNTDWVEIERDGEHEYWECEECGYAWGWRPAAEEGGVRIDASCQIGVPEDVRRAYSMDPTDDGTVNLGASIPVGRPS